MPGLADKLCALWALRSRDGDHSDGDSVESRTLKCPSDGSDWIFRSNLGSSLERASGDKTMVADDEGDEDVFLTVLIDGPLKTPTSGTKVVACTRFTPWGLL